MRLSVLLGDATINPEDDTDKPAQEALHWLIALQETPGDPDLQARFAAWRSASEDNAHAWAEAVRVWRVLGEAPAAAAVESARSRQGADPDTPPKGIVRTAMARRDHSRTGRLGRRRIGGLAIAALSACLILISLPTLTFWLNTDYGTGTAELRMIKLEDGTQVHLGPHSAIDVAYSPVRRKVRLLAGEAFFDVTPDSARAFVVEAGGVETAVLGTAFEVRLSPRATTVSVAEGHVRVSPSEDNHHGLETTLDAGHWTRIAADGTVEGGEIVPDMVASWRTGLLIVSDKTVGDVIERVGRYYAGTVMMLDPGLSNRRVTGVYELDNPASALRAVAEAHGATVRQVSPWLTIISGL